ncbi:unnamed protein product [Macrosiphum euphorbiae]|uniref:Uncharacterized protein n=1 Tax=Macrosiphum euphorbiae TaxID=13131 RepID=A0AAV0VNJ6_9HEMI|nr:unnamed protein product [Macrosiphum euphorbiae]
MYHVVGLSTRPVFVVIASCEKRLSGRGDREGQFGTLWGSVSPLATTSSINRARQVNGVLVVGRGCERECELEGDGEEGEKKRF